MTLPRIKGSGPALEAEDHDRNMLFLSGFPSLAAMLADTTRGYSFYEPGQGIVVLKEGYRYRVAASNASDHHLTTASGLKLYVAPSDEDIYNFGAFNPAANGTTNDYAKLRMALDVVATGEAPNKVGPTIFFPQAVYKINSTVELNTKVTLLGAGGSAEGSVFLFAQNVSGFVVNAFNTGNGMAISEEDATTAGLSGAAGSIFKGLLFASRSLTQNPSVRLDVDGIWLRAPAAIVDCNFTRWPGSGVLIEAWDPADKPGEPEFWGDARGWRLNNNTGNWCGRSALRVRGTRADGGICALGNFVSNGWWGYDDHATGTNLYIGNHSATNGTSGAAVNAVSVPKNSGIVSRGGIRYRAAAIFGEDGDPDPDHLENLVNIPPGDDPAVWQFRATGNGTASAIPTWAAGLEPGQYFPVGGYKFSNPLAGHVGIGNYTEDDEAGTYYNGENMFVAGGIQTYRHKGGTLTGVNGLPSFVQGTRFENDEMVVRLAENGTTRRGMTVTRGESVWNLFNPAPDSDMVFGKEGEVESLRITGPAPLYAYGTTSGASSPRRYMVHTPTLALGDGEDDDEGRRQTTLAAAPTTGEWAQGDIVWNLEPEAGGNAAWICTTAGTPGTWKTCLPIAE